MPAENDAQPPGRNAERKKSAPRPTVVHPPSRDDAPPDAAADVAEPAESPRPTVMQPRSSAAGHMRAQHPAVDEPGPVPPPVTTPTAVRGIERKRLPVGLDDLRNLSPGTKPDVLERALQMLQSYVVEDGTDRDTILWGNQLQRDYADLVSEMLSLTQADPLIRVGGYLNRMIEILKSIDLAAVSATATESSIGKYLKKMNRKIDSPEELRGARVELDQLVGLMSAAMDDLLDLKEKLQQSSGRIDQIGDDVEASALSAQFLSTYLQDKEKKLSQMFLERSMSLTQTALQIRGSTTMRETQIEQPLRLIDAIQNVALVMVPGWLGSIASLTVVTQGRKLTPTEAGELTYQLRKILEQLET